MLALFHNKKTESIKPSAVEEHPVADTLFRDLEDQVDVAVVQAQMRGAHMEDYSKGGVSDGWLPMTPTPRTDEEFEKARLQEEEFVVMQQQQDEEDEDEA